MESLKHYVQGQWVEGKGEGEELVNAATGEPIATLSAEGIDRKGMLEYAREKGGPALRKMTFHERGRAIKALAKYLDARKKAYYPLSYQTGATKIDSWPDIDGGISTAFVVASKARRELPDKPYLVEGHEEMLSANGTFIGQHIAAPLHGAAIHINAFNFPVWGMLEKLAPSIIGGMPCVIKPAGETSFLTQRVFQDIIESGILPEGSVQLLCGDPGDLLEHVNSQDVVAFTGSAETGKRLKTKDSIVQNATRFNMEADSLNCCVLGPDATPDTEEFKLFIKEVSREIISKAGQKCTAIRRAIVPSKYSDDVINGLTERLGRIKMGDPSMEEVKMGALVSKRQVKECQEKLEELLKGCEVAYGQNMDELELVGGDKEKGAFMAPTVLYCNDPLEREEPHNVEAFGPVSTVMPYESTDEAAQLARMGKGSLVGSIFSADKTFARDMVMETASHHGRLMLIDKDSAKESTGHGSPLAHLVHGGPGRAGGGEELGGVRGVMHHLQRCALQGHPTTLTHVTGRYLEGGEKPEAEKHPFKQLFDDLEVGETLTTHKRTITETDIVNFANVSWDNFYAHTDITAVGGEDDLFEDRVAHGYFIMSAAAGLFVNPEKGPVLANYGIDELRFTKPVYPNTTIQCQLTVKEKAWKEKREENEIPKGEVRWRVEVTDDEGETVMLATILTLIRRREQEDEVII